MPDTKSKIRYWSICRQCLDEQAANAEQALSDVIGVYSSHPTTALSLHARVKGFSEQAFARLDEERLAFRVPAMRESVYMVPRETAVLTFSATIPPATDPYWEKRYSQKGRSIPPDKYPDWQEAILRLAKRPFTAKDLKAATDIPHDAMKPVLNRMAFEGHLLRVGSKSLRSNIISYVSAKAWANDQFVRVESETAQAWLAGEYLRAFGPARVRDFQWWAGIPAGAAQKAIAAHKTIAVEGDYLLPAADLPAFDAFTPPNQDTLAILPRWDCYTMGYAPDGRSRFVTADTQAHVYGKIGATGGNALGVVLLNGLAVGAWTSRFKGASMVVALNLFEKPTGRIRQAIEARFHEMAALLKAKKVVLQTG